MKQRPSPVCFWEFAGKADANARPWIDPRLQQGTTPLVKLMAGKPTRTFRNFHHPKISENDFAGWRAIISQGFKLVIRGTGPDAKRELFNLRHDDAEANNQVAKRPALAKQLELDLTTWQQSVLESLTGADYRQAAAE
jgi:hypothetical protein